MKLWLEKISFVAIVMVILTMIFYPVMDDTPGHQSYSSTDLLDRFFIELDKNEVVKKAENIINSKTKEKQGIQKNNNTKKTSTNKVIIPNSLTNAEISTIQVVESKIIEDKPEATFTSSKSIKEFTQSLGSKSPNINDIKDLQGVYQESLDRLTNEERFEDLLKNNSQKYLDIIEL